MGGPSGPLARFLRAEKFNMQKAEKRLKGHAAWRADYVPSGRIFEVSARAAVLTCMLPVITMVTAYLIGA